MTGPYVVTISSEKGGVGKTTLATNLAIYLKALVEELPVTLLSFDNHFSVDRMFRIGRGAPAGAGTVRELLCGTPPEALVELGQYGVQFIPSWREVDELRRQTRTVADLGLILAGSRLPGVLIIDTRPDLDILTRNALFAADRVIVPVKDAPSLENCRHLHEFFDRCGLPRRTLRLLPCLIDSRIRFDGPFKNISELLRAYAINRGYRCFDGFISKSPKVESLNTNPEGKIYPVLTYGRNTEVHGQFTHLARQVYQDLQNTPVLRAMEIAQRLAQQETATTAQPVGDTAEN